MKLELKLSNNWLEATWYIEENESKTQVHCEYFSGHPEHIAMLRAKAIEYETVLDEAIVSELIAGYVPPPEPTQEEVVQEAIKNAEHAVQAYINSVVVSRGYDNENSIAKYLVEGNPFYAECKALSLWIGSVWVATHEVQSEVVLTGVLPTIEELMVRLPVFSME